MCFEFGGGVECKVLIYVTFKNHPLYSHTSEISLTALLGLALGKHTKQSSTLGAYGAEYAVDGNRGTDIFKDMCTHTAENDTNPWWRVDLLTVYSIKSVRILNRGIDSGEGKRTKYQHSKIEISCMDTM